VKESGESQHSDASIFLGLLCHFVAEAWPSHFLVSGGAARWYGLAMKRAEVQLPDPLYQQVEGLAQKLHVSVPELLRNAAEQMVQRQRQAPPQENGDWRFPEARNLGAFRVPVEDWRLLANEAATP
jgi:hypothetical protein